MASNFDLLAKILILGDSGVGKSSLLLQYCESVFPENHVATIGIDFKMKQITCDDIKVRMQIWDTAGQERYRKITRTFYNGASGIILVYDITNQESFHNIEDWIKQIDLHAQEQVIKIIVGNKCDRADRKVTTQQGESLAEKYNVSFIEVSAMENTLVNNMFELLTRQVIKSGNVQNKRTDTAQLSNTKKSSEKAGCCAK